MMDLDDDFFRDEDRSEARPTLDEFRRRRAAEFLRGDLGGDSAVDASREPMYAPSKDRSRETRGLPTIDWGATGAPALAPKLLDFPKPPPGAPGGWLDNDPLPSADVVVMTWTSAEWDALHYVFSNALEPLPQDPDDNRMWRSKWYPYRRSFHTIYPDLWTRRLIGARRNRSGGAPALRDRQWGRFCMVDVAGKRVLLFKSELHINQDGETLPLVQLTRQILDECRPNLLLSVGTSGGVRHDDVLGDVVVTNAAKFRLGDEFSDAPFNHASYQCKSWSPPDAYLDGASKLLMAVPEYEAHPPTAHFPEGAVLRPHARDPKIHLLPSVPLLTTDFFEYGTTTNGLEHEGCCVEMDDAVLAMICEDDGPHTRYGFVRNISDPVINGALPRSLQTAWAVVTYQKKGLYTSYNGAIAAWAMIAGS